MPGDNDLDQANEQQSRDNEAEHIKKIEWKAIGDRYAARLSEEARMLLKDEAQGIVDFGIPEPDEEDEFENSPSSFISAGDDLPAGQMPKPGRYPVYHGKDRVEQDHKIYVDKDGKVRPNPMTPAGWRDSINLLGKAGCRTITLHCLAKPNLPEEAMNDLLMQAHMCVQKGLEVKLSSDAIQFVDGISKPSFFQNSADAYLSNGKVKLLELIETSQLRRAETMVMDAAAPGSWISTGKTMLQEESKSDILKAEQEGRADLDDIEAEKKKVHEEGIKLVETMAEELDKGYEQLVSIQDQLSKLQQAETSIMQNPERLAKAENIIGDFETKWWGFGRNNERQYAGEVLSAMDKEATEDTTHRKLAMIETKNSSDKLKTKQEVIELLGVKRQQLLTLRDELKTKLLATNDFPNKKNIENNLGKKYDALNAGGALQKKQEAVSAWYNSANPVGWKATKDKADQQVKENFAAKPFYKKL